MSDNQPKHIPCSVIVGCKSQPILVCDKMPPYLIIHKETDTNNDILLASGDTDVNSDTVFNTRNGFDFEEWENVQDAAFKLFKELGEVKDTLYCYYSFRKKSFSVSPTGKRAYSTLADM